MTEEADFTKVLMPCNVPGYKFYTLARCNTDGIINNRMWTDMVGGNKEGKCHKEFQFMRGIDGKQYMLQELGMFANVYSYMTGIVPNSVVVFRHVDTDLYHEFSTLEELVNVIEFEKNLLNDMKDMDLFCDEFVEDLFNE